MQSGAAFRMEVAAGCEPKPCERRSNALAYGIDGVLQKARTTHAGEPAFARLAKLIRRASVSDMRRFMVPDGVEERGHKYLRLDWFLERHLGHVRLLGLENAAGESVLDLGGGVGYFAFVARAYGHSVTVLEPMAYINAGVVLDYAYEWLRITATRQGIYRQQPLILDAALTGKAGKARRFDRITSWATMWNYWAPEGQSYWQADDYRFLFHDLRRFLRRGAPLHVQFNGMLFGEPAGTATPSIADYYQSLGNWLSPLITGHDVPTHTTTLDIWRDIPAPTELSMPDPEDITPERTYELIDQAKARSKAEARALRLERKRTQG